MLGASIQLFVTLRTLSRQAPLSKGFSRKEYCSELPFPPPWNLPDLGIEPTSLVSSALAGGFLTTSAAWEAAPWGWGCGWGLCLRSAGPSPPELCAGWHGFFQKTQNIPSQIVKCCPALAVCFSAQFVKNTAPETHQVFCLWSLNSSCKVPTRKALLESSRFRTARWMTLGKACTWRAHRPLTARQGHNCHHAHLQMRDPGTERWNVCSRWHRDYMWESGPRI